MLKPKRFLPYSKQLIDKDDIAGVTKVLKSDFITQGPNIFNFEKKFANFVGAKYAVACATGTAALHISCLAMGITNKSAIATSPITFVASANCGEFIGAKTHFVDIEKNTNCISPKNLERLLKKKKINLVIAVHLAGHSSDMKKLYQLKKKYKFNLIEDACHALGGKFLGHKIGSCKFSDISTFSFHPVKPLTTAEGGMVTTNDKKLYDKMILYRSHGIHKNRFFFKNKRLALDKKKQTNKWYYEMSHLGYNYRMTDIQASLGITQLKKLKKFQRNRNKIAVKYNSFFKKLDNIKIPFVRKNVTHTYHLYTLLIDYKKINKTRNEVMSFLQKNSIGSQVLYIPVFMQPYYKNKYKFNEKKFPNTMEYYGKALSIPIFSDLKKSEQEYIIKKITSIINQ